MSTKFMSRFHASETSAPIEAMSALESDRTGRATTAVFQGLSGENLQVPEDHVSLGRIEEHGPLQGGQGCVGVRRSPRRPSHPSPTTENSANNEIRSTPRMVASIAAPREARLSGALGFCRVIVPDEIAGRRGLAGRSIVAGSEEIRMVHSSPVEAPRPSVGTSVPRLDGAAKVTGEARYVDDLPRKPGELHGATVRSAVPRGRLRGVRLDPAFDWSDVTVVRAEDVAVNNVALIVEDQPILAADRINHVYEPVVLLACADKAKLARAMRAVTLDIEELPPVFDMEASLARAQVIAGEDNVQKRYLITKGRADVKAEPDAVHAASAEAIAAALAACDVVVEGRYFAHHQEQLYIEPQGVIAWWDAAGVHATGSIQCPFYVHKAFTKAFELRRAPSTSPRR